MKPRKNRSGTRDAHNKTQGAIQPAQQRVYKADLAQTVAIRRRLEKHARSCTYYIFSGDRHCSCGRDDAILELEKIRGQLRAVSSVKKPASSGASKKV